MNAIGKEKAAGILRWFCQDACMIVSEKTFVRDKVATINAVEKSRIVVPGISDAYGRLLTKPFVGDGFVGADNIRPRQVVLALLLGQRLWVDWLLPGECYPPLQKPRFF